MGANTIELSPRKRTLNDWQIRKASECINYIELLKHERFKLRDLTFFLSGFEHETKKASDIRYSPLLVWFLCIQFQNNLFIFVFVSKEYSTKGLV